MQANEHAQTHVDEDPILKFPFCSFLCIEIMITSAEKASKVVFDFLTSIYNEIILWIFRPQIVPQLSVSES